MTGIYSLPSWAVQIYSMIRIVSDDNKGVSRVWKSEIKR